MRTALPFLPWINARQTFCAQPRVVEFRSGTEIRYLSHYAQGPGLSVLDELVGSLEIRP